MKADMDKSIRLAYEETRKRRGLGRWPVPSTPKVRDFYFSPERFIAYRQARNMTATQMSQRLGMPLSSLQMWESGARMPTRETVFEVADKLECYVWEIAEEGM